MTFFRSGAAFTEGFQKHMDEVDGSLDGTDTPVRHGLPILAKQRLRKELSLNFQGLLWYYTTVIVNVSTDCVEFTDVRNLRTRVE